MKAQKDQSKRAGRVTWLATATGRQTANALYSTYGEVSAAASYPAFRQRLKSLESRKIPITHAQIHDAAQLDRAEWMTLYGGGRRKAFIYDGTLYPEFAGRYPAFSAFLKKIGRYQDRAMLYSRLKAHWAVDDLLAEPPTCAGAPGYIYKITDEITGRCYVGLSVNKPEVRLAQHRYLASNGGGSLLHKAMRSNGVDNFSIVELEIVDDAGCHLIEREIYWISHLQTLHPNGLNKSKGGQIGSYHGKPVEADSRRFTSIAQMNRILSDETGLPEHVVERRFRAGKALPKKVRKHSKHENAGTPLFRQHQAILRAAKDGRFSVDPDWLCYDNFKADITNGPEGTELTRSELTLPFGPNNWTWMTRQEINSRLHSKPIEALGRKWNSIEEALVEFGIGRGTFNYRVKHGMSIGQALTLPLGATSKRNFSFNGQIWPSRNQACKELSIRYNITPDKVKDRIVRKVPVSRWLKMDNKV